MSPQPAELVDEVERRVLARLRAAGVPVGRPTVEEMGFDRCFPNCVCGRHLDSNGEPLQRVAATDTSWQRRRTP